jgi:hypothetical protein
MTELRGCDGALGALLADDCIDGSAGRLARDRREKTLSLETPNEKAKKHKNPSTYLEIIQSTYTIFTYPN